MRERLRFMGAFVLFGMVAATTQALNLYADNAGTNRIDVIDPATGAVTHSCTPAKGNGRGMVVVGTTAFFTVADSNNVFEINIGTCADMGVAFSVAGATGLSTIAYDGTNFWIGDYSGTNKAFYYSPTGTLIKTITLSMCTSFCDGLEFFKGKLISNRGDDANAPYDVYDTDGNVIQAAFITPSTNSTGIAFDGTNFFISHPLNGTVDEFDGTTGAFIKTLTLSGASGFAVEDLSFDYTQVLPTPTPGPGATPTPGPRPTAAVPTLSFPMLEVLAGALAAAALYLLMKRGS